MFIFLPHFHHFYSFLFLYSSRFPSLCPSSVSLLFSSLFHLSLLPSLSSFFSLYFFLLLHFSLSVNFLNVYFMSFSPFLFDHFIISPSHFTWLTYFSCLPYPSFNPSLPPSHGQFLHHTFPLQFSLLSIFLRFSPITFCTDEKKR